MTDVTCTACRGTGRRHPEDRGYYVCFDCGGASALYRVRDEVWLTAWPDYKAVRAELLRRHLGTSEEFRFMLALCFSCLEVRLGRRLTIGDFEGDMPANESLLFGFKMRDEVRDGASR